VAVLAGDDQIGRVAIVEPVELEPAIEHWQDPFQEVDEDALGVLEQGPQRPICAGVRASAFDDDRHALVSSFGSKHRGPGRPAVLHKWWVSAAKHVEKADGPV